MRLEKPHVTFSFHPTKKRVNLHFPQDTMVPQASILHAASVYQQGHHERP